MGENALFFQASSNLPEVITSRILLKYPSYYLRLMGIRRQLTIRINIVSIALALCHFGTAVLKFFPEAVLLYGGKWDSFIVLSASDRFHI